MPACCDDQQQRRRASTRWPSTGYGILDVPHRFIVAPIWQLPFGKDRKWQERRSANAAGRRLDGRGGHQLPERLPDRRRAERQPRTLLGNAQRPNLVTGVDSRRTGDLGASAGVGRSSDGDVAQPGGVHAGAGRHVRQRTASRSPTSARRGSSTPTCRSSKNFGLGGGKSAQIKLEVINLFNRVQTEQLSSVDGRAARRSVRSTRSPGSCG